MVAPVPRSGSIRRPRDPDEQRKPERELWAAFERDRPLILGALLDAVSAALAGHSRIVMRRQPRMADFARWVAAAKSFLGWPTGAFLGAYGRNRASAQEVALDAASIVPPLLALIIDTWSGTSSELLEQLLAKAANSDDERRRIGRRHDWPDGPKALSDQLRRLKPDLRQIGVQITFRKSTNGRRVVAIARLRGTGIPAPLPPLRHAIGAGGAGSPTNSASTPPRTNGAAAPETVLDFNAPLCDKCGRRMRGVPSGVPAPTSARSPIPPPRRHRHDRLRADRDVGNAPRRLDPIPLEVGGALIVMRLPAEEVQFLSTLAVDLPSAIRRALAGLIERIHRAHRSGGNGMTFQRGAPVQMSSRCRPVDANTLPRRPAGAPLSRKRAPCGLHRARTPDFILPPESAAEVFIRAGIHLVLDRIGRHRLASPECWCSPVREATFDPP